MAVETARRRVAVSALPGARRTAAETATSRGADLAQARGEGSARVWEAVSRAAAPIERMGQEMFRQIQIEERQKANEVALLAARNKLSEWKNRALYDPQNGAFTKKGADSMTVPEDIGADFDKTADEITASLGTDEQKAAFARMLAEERENVDLSVRRHVFQEMQTYRAGELKSTVANASNAATLAADDPREVARQIAIGVEAIKTNAPRLGSGPEETEEQVRAFQSATHVGVIRNLATQGKDKQAKAYFEEAVARGEISGDQKDDVQAMLETASTQGEGLRSAREIWAQFGPKGDKDPIEFDKMEEEVARRYGDDPKQYAATMAFLKERKAAIDVARKEREETIGGNLWRAAASGSSLEAIQRMPEYLEAPGRVQAQITDYIVGKLERQASRAAAEESRAFTAEQRGQARKERKGWGRFWELSNPQTLSKMSDNQLEMLRGELGDDHVNRLHEMKRRATEPANLREATVDDDAFKVAAQKRGLDAFDPDDDEKVQLGQLRDAVETQIDAEQRAAGNKEISRERKDQIIAEIMDKRVSVTTWGGLSSEERIAATVQNPNDRAKAFVPIAKMPEQVIASYLNYARSLSPALQRMGDKELRDRLASRMQRAYGLRLLGASGDEIRAALKGND